VDESLLNKSFKPIVFPQRHKSVIRNNLNSTQNELQIKNLE